MQDRAAQIRSNLEGIRGRMARAAERSGRREADVRLVVVTKLQPVEVIRAAVDAGAVILGENYPEETEPKIEALRELPVAWHMIGHLQSRKAKIVAAHFDMMHSLDGLSLAEKLNRLLAENGRQLPVLLELNVGEEESKSGWRVRDEADWSRLLPDVEAILQLKQLQVSGLMTMPPLEMEAEQARPYFARLRALRDRLQQTFPVCDWRELSMGTSADFEVAIEEGATYVRIGQAVLGPRPPKGV